jgi:hypothetical protein
MRSKTREAVKSKERDAVWEHYFPDVGKPFDDLDSRSLKIQSQCREQ